MKKYLLRIRKIDKFFFDTLRQGSKTIETRAATDKFLNIKKGDTLVFVCGKQRLEKRVKKVSYFKTIDRMLKKLNLKKIMPFVSSIEEAKRIYYSFPNYNKKIAKFGLVAIELE
ncbi:MAG: hypothetical protein IB617_02300 [Candidatus Nealsonbacteria bacterium]|nr:MAG: hypothetical protein IB617_02300 [Candidatus Nealsonbacteria bacterium]